MSLYCDRCGVKLHNERIEFEFDNIEKYLIQPKKENLYPADLITDIKKAYYLSTIIDEENIDNQNLIEKYLNYVYLRILYERDKNFLLTDHYSTPKAKAILSSLVSRKITKEMMDYLEEEFPEEIEKQCLPKDVIHNIDKPYLTELNIHKLLPKKSKMAVWFSVVKSIIFTALFFILIGGGLFYLYYQNQGFSTSRMIQEAQTLLNENLEIGLGIIAAVFLIGLIRGLRNKKLRFLTKFMKQNTQFHKHVKQVCNKKYKLLNSRIKKGKRT